jgi:hypothetical protein
MFSTTACAPTTSPIRFGRPHLSMPHGAIQLDDVFVDERQIVCAVIGTSADFES